MDFQKSYPHPRLNGETIVLQWSRGYQEVKVWCRKRLVQTISNPRGLLKGVTFSDEELGLITIILSRNPYFLNVQVDGFHSQFNVLHPQKIYPGRRYWLLIPIIVYVFILVSLVDIFGWTGINFYLFINIVVTSIPLVSAIVAFFGVKMNKWWPLIIWYSVMILQGLILLYMYLRSLFNALAEPDNQWAILQKDEIAGAIITAVLYLFFLWCYYKLLLVPGWQSRKHSQNQTPLDQTLLDSHTL